MTRADQSRDLEKAIIERGKLLADEHIRQGEQNRSETLRASADRLRLLEEKEILFAKSHAEREFRRRVRASEIHMQANLDRLRWALISEILDRLQTRLRELVEDESRYLPVLTKLFASAAKAIERNELIAAVNEADQHRFGATWQDIAAAAAPEKTIALAPQSRACTGGVLVSTPDDLIRVDNTFEGRLERLEPELCRIILERLFPSPIQMEMLFDG